MKKTLTINISGIIFNIDDDAYDSLKSYLETLKKYFSKTTGKDEIISDIETRIAELLQEKMSDSKQVITLDDINEIIRILGQPSDFIEEEEGEEKTAPRDEPRAPKRFYRDPDNSILGGVCGGLGAYFNIDPLWFRLLFIFLVLVGGSGIAIYLILWIAVPKAKTTAEKLEMRGERVNVSNIEKSIREELDNIKSTINDLTSKARSGYKKKSESAGTILEDIGGIILALFKILLRIVVISVGILLLLVGVAAIIGFLTSMFGWGGFIFIDNNDLVTFPFQAFFDMIFTESDAAGLFEAGVLLLIGIPLFMLIYSGSKLIFRFEGIRFIGVTALNLWLIGLIITIYFAFKIGRQFRDDHFFEDRVSIEQPVGDTIWITANEGYTDRIAWEHGELFEFEEIKVAMSENGDAFGMVELEIRNSPDDKYHLVKHYSAHGRTINEAESNAMIFPYAFTQRKDTLIFNPFFTIDKEKPWRNQQIWLEVQVPRDHGIHIDKNLKGMLKYRSNHNPWKLSGKTWIMRDDALISVEEVDENKE